MKKESKAKLAAIDAQLGEMWSTIYYLSKLHDETYVGLTEVLAKIEATQTALHNLRPVV